MDWIEILVLVLSFLILLGIGVPIAFSIGLASIFTMSINMDVVPAFTTMAQRMATGLDSFTLLAIPFFVLAGQMMNKGGIAQRLIDLARAMVGPLPGGLAYVNIIACALFGAVAGSSVAAASAIGGFMHPQMKKEGYDEAFSAAVNIASSTNGLIIPPSNVMIVYSLASGGVSITALFLAGYVPGILLAFSLMLVSGFIAYRKKYPVGNSPSLIFLVKKFFAALPSLMLLVIVMGGIIGGIFTATEASAIAVLYTAILSMGLYQEIKIRDLPEILLQTVNTTAIVMLLIGTSIGMSWVMSYENIPQDLSIALLSLSNDKVVILLIINLILLFVGTFMDITPAILIFTPIFLPIVQQVGVDPTHFGMIMVVNLCIGICTPPVGSVLFVGCGVAQISIAKVIRPLLPMFLAMIVVLMLVTYIPELSLWIPRLFGY
ncbi:MAG: TRAP transporter large permease [Microscillaceae bacterium]|nr:TRAP transporter large permease [Microscillaceae bacterium]